MWKAKSPALQIFAGIPFGPGADELLSWIYFGGGLALYDELYHRYGVHGVICGIAAAEGAGWFPQADSQPSRTSRACAWASPASVARAIERLGVTARTLPPGDLFAALESGEIRRAPNSRNRRWTCDSASPGR